MGFWSDFVGRLMEAEQAGLKGAAMRIEAFHEIRARGLEHQQIAGETPFGIFPRGGMGPIFWRCARQVDCFGQHRHRFVEVPERVQDCEFRARVRVQCLDEVCGCHVGFSKNHPFP